MLKIQSHYIFVQDNRMDCSSLPVSDTIAIKHISLEIDEKNFNYLFPGHGTDYLNLAIRDGGVSLTMGLANGKQEMHIKPARVRFDDHQWHKVTVHRRIQEISSITSFCRVSLLLIIF